MRYYNSYISRQEISRETHEKLLALTARRRPGRPWMKYGTLAACAALIVGIGVWKLAPVSSPASSPASTSESTGQFAPGYTPLPGETDTVMVEPEYSFVVSSPAEDGKLMFPMIPAIDYSNPIPDNVDGYVYSEQVFYGPGAFTADLTKEDIQAIFWGLEGKPEAIHPKAEQGDLPWMLFWDGYTVHGSAQYDGQGQLKELTVFGEQDQASFILELRPGALPVSSRFVGSIYEDQLNKFNGVSIDGWSDGYGLTVNGKRHYTCVCGSEFTTADRIGVRFENRNSLIQAEYDVDEDMELDGARTFNALFVRQAIAGGLYLDHLMTAGYVPAWREESFSSLAQTRQEAEFAPYLPAQDPEGYTSYAGSKEFDAHLSYQEGGINRLSVCWSRGCGDIEASIYRDGYDSYNLADANDPASYDLRLYNDDVRLYDIKWRYVPEEYLDTVNRPAFRAEDMSLSIVEARGIGTGTGGLHFRFDIVHPDGTVVSYRCDGMTVQEMWELVEGTL